jgi:AraC-like DNA-binding protein
VIAISNTATMTHRPERSSVEVSDVAEMCEVLETAYGARLRLSASRPSRGQRLRHSRTDAGAFAIEQFQFPVQLETSPDPLDKVIVVWPTDGKVDVHCSGVAGEAGPDELTMVSQPDLPHRAQAQNPSVTAVLIDPSLVAEVATGVSSGNTPLPIRFSSFQPVDLASARLWKETVRYMKDVVLADDTLATPLVLGQAARLLAAVTLSTFPNTITTEAAPHDRTDHQPPLLRRAMEFIDANVANDIALADIAQAVHITPRAVQYMFRRHLDLTPLQYLRRMRLHYAHQELVASDGAHATVTGIAARWGFTHTGRFAVLYRQTYGQSPHTTLRG